MNMPILDGLVMIIQLTEKCNLGCVYCYLRKKKRIDMSLKTAYATVDFANALLAEKMYNNVTLCFHGGEPTLVFELVKKIVKRAKAAKKIDKFIIGTNAICIDKQKIDFLVENNFSPTVSLDGIALAQNLNRPFLDGSGSWEKVDKSLDLFGIQANVWSNRTIPDPFRIRISFTPQTLPYLSESVRYVTNKEIGKTAVITIMPAMSLNNSWKDAFKKGGLEAELNRQMHQIADIYLNSLKANRPLNFCINECLTPSWSSLLSPLGLRNEPFCGAGGFRVLGISLEGGVYPCYLHAANPKEHKSMLMGDVFTGINNPQAINNFCGGKKNKNFSCLYWNNFENGSADEPAFIYTMIYKAWKDAVLYIQGKINES